MIESSLAEVPVGQIPPLGLVPRRMHAWVIRRERHGDPSQSFKRELLPVPEPGPDEALVLVMAAGINFNGVWAGLGKPVSVLDVHRQPFHVAGSDASGIIWKVGSQVTRWKVGDEVVLHCNITCGQPRRALRLNPRGPRPSRFERRK